MENQGNSIFAVTTFTGDRTFARNYDDVFIQLFDDNDSSTPTIKLSHKFEKQKFERGEVTRIMLDAKDTAPLSTISNIKKIRIWREIGEQVFFFWYLDKIEIQNLDTSQIFLFPVCRWIRRDVCYEIQVMDTSLPQNCPTNVEKFRKIELEHMRTVYQIDHKFPIEFPNGPVQAKEVVKEEYHQQENIMTIAQQKTKLIAAAKRTVEEHITQINSLDELYAIYSEDFKLPEKAAEWNSDDHFANQRLAGLNHSIIELVTSIPSKFPVTNEHMKTFLEGLTIKQAIDRKLLFICDLHILDGLKVKKDLKLCAPIALFFLNGKKQLTPVAIQLNQKPGRDNPIFTPESPTWTWTLAKMWFNHADAAYHQALTHLGFTHLLVEGFSLATHRQLSISHPVFKILAPHFLYLHLINKMAFAELLPEGGWIDRATNYGSKGMYELVIRGYKFWRVDQHGLLPNDLKRRGVYDPDILPNYPYRDDGLLLYNAISDYVKCYLALYYKDNSELQADYEIQNWAQELVKERNVSEGGMGILGLPGNGSLTSLDQLKDIVTCVIYISSVGHAAANFPQYDEYGFPPNYPSILIGEPPKNAKQSSTMADVIKAFPDIHHIMDTMTITKVLSTKSTRSLGDFEVQYICDPNALPLVTKFRNRLKEISTTIKERNMHRIPSYNYLDPETIPNAISI